MKRIIATIIFLIPLIFSLRALAAPPDAGSIMREVDEKPTVLPERPKEPSLQLVPPPPSPAQGPKVLVEGFRISGATMLSEAELQSALAGSVGRELSFAEINQALQKLSAAYSARGYLAQTVLPPQELKDGIIQVQVVEGKFGEVLVETEPGVRLGGYRAAAFITARQAANQPLNLNQVEKGLMFLNDLPGVLSRATLQPGSIPGTTDLNLRLEKPPLFSGSLDFDNFGSVSTGEHRLSANLNVSSPLGIGDQLNVRGLSSIDNNFGRLGYSLPLNYSGTRLGASFSYLHYELGGDLADLNARGNALTTGINLSQPLLRGRERNIGMSLGYDYRTYDNSAQGSETSNKTIHAGTVGINAGQFDGVWGGGYTGASLLLTAGNLDLSGNAQDLAADAVGRKADGGYYKVSYSLTRLHNLHGNRTMLWLSLNGQFAGSNLDSSEQMSLGGPDAVRALPPSEASGDQGLVLSTELRHNLTPALQLFGFYDFGWIKQHATTWDGWNSPGNNPNEYDVSGAGLGISLSLPGQLSVKATVAERLTSNPGGNANGKDSDGTKREPRFWVQAGYHF